MPGKAKSVLAAQPSILNLGSHYVGAMLRGSFQVLNANSFREMNFSACGGAACSTSPVPDWIELRGPRKAGQNGLPWDFTIHANQPDRYLASITIECDNGVATCQISVNIREGIAELGDLVICASPFDCYTSFESISALVRILNALPIRTHCLDSLCEIGDLRPRTVVLHGSGLLVCKATDAAVIERLVASGVNIILLANEFYHGTPAAANRLMAPFGMQMKQRGSDEPGIGRDEKLRRITEWARRYDQEPFEASPADIREHILTTGVKKLHWFRPSPVIFMGANAISLVANPKDPNESFAAVAGAPGYVIALGESLLNSFSEIGWPYDNDRFLANLFVGNDADSFNSRGMKPPIK